MKASTQQNKLYFIRHGCTDWNVNKLCQGHRDIELNEIGRHEAKMASELMSDLAISKIYSSPLKRALETAQIIQLSIFSIKIEILDQLKERNWGELEGISSEEMYKLEEREEQDPTFHIGKGVEDRHSFHKRLIEGIKKVFENEGTSLIVSHGRVFHALCEIFNLPPMRQIPNAKPIELTLARDSVLQFIQTKG